MNNRRMYFKGRLVVASIAVLLALAVTALKRDDTRRKAAAGGAGTMAAERSAAEISAVPADGTKLLKGEGAYGGWREDAPGVRRLIEPADLPKPYATKSADNDARVVSRPSHAWPQALPGFKVDQIASGLSGPRLIRTAPNGDLFIAESHKGQIRVLRGIGADGRAQTVGVFATGLNKPFGIAFYPPGANPQFVYVANTGSVVKFPYQNGDLKARGKAQTVVATIPGGGLLHGGGHWTRDIAFTADGQKMFVSVGSHSNVDDDAEEDHRADILEFNPDGSGERIYAAGIRNGVGIAIDPSTGVLWTSVNERDDLGDDLVPDYITSVKDGGRQTVQAETAAQPKAPTRSCSFLSASPRRRSRKSGERTTSDFTVGPGITSGRIRIRAMQGSIRN